MPKALIFSDAHIHMHKSLMSRLDDGLRVLEWVFRTAVERGIHIIVFGGDLLQDRQKIHVISYEKTFNLIRRFMSNYPDLRLYLLVGNHDMWFNDKWDVSSISPYEAIPGVEVINRPSAVEIAPGYTIDFLPYTKNPPEDIAKHFKEKSPVLIAHIAVDGAQLNSHHQSKAEVSVEFEGDMTKVDVGLFSCWERVFMGHYHCAQKLNDRVEYVGSPYELNFGEANQEKHIVVLDLDTLETEYVVNDFSPKHLILKPEQVADHKLDGNFVQVVVDDITCTNIVDLRKEILSESKTATLEFKERKKEKVKEDADEAQKRFDFESGEVLERYMKAKGYGGLDYDKLLAIGKEICQDS
jgi:DNA repair exonuclease SbcCD nuclease subunit